MGEKRGEIEMCCEGVGGLKRREVKISRWVRESKKERGRQAESKIYISFLVGEVWCQLAYQLTYQVGGGEEERRGKGGEWEKTEVKRREDKRV